MILNALKEYYERLLIDPDCDIAQPGFEKKAIPYLLVIDRDGHFKNIRDTRTGEGKRKVGREFLVPQGEKKASGIKANLLWDNPQYVLGFSRGESDKEKQRAQNSLAAFERRILETFGDSTTDEGIVAVKAFLVKKDFADIFQHGSWPDIQETNSNLTFLLEGDVELVAQRKFVVNQVVKNVQQKDSSQICAVSGEEDSPANLHSSIKGVWGAQSSGASIVSFNLQAFCSFGKKQGLNVPIGQRTMFAYSTVLNTLLANGSRQRMQVGDTSTVFWTKGTHPFEEDFSCFLEEPSKGKETDYIKIRSLLRSVKSGVLPPDDDMQFYVLGLAPNAARISIRFWYEGSVRDMKEKIAQHFEDIEIVRAPHDREFLSLFQLLVATATESKADNIPPNLGGEVFRAVIAGLRYPRTLLAGAIRRCKAEQKVTHARAALIKGFLVRDARLRGKTKEVQMALDKTNDNMGYVLGRLFAVLERVQEQALDGLNKTIRDTYFSAATSNPLVIFKRLQDLAVHHLAKMRNNGKNTVWLDKLMQEVIGLIPASGIPAILTLNDQGRFAIGYYHQRQDFFKKGHDKTKEDNDE